MRDINSPSMRMAAAAAVILVILGAVFWGKRGPDEVQLATEDTPSSMQVTPSTMDGSLRFSGEPIVFEAYAGALFEPTLSAPPDAEQGSKLALEAARGASVNAGATEPAPHSPLFGSFTVPLAEGGAKATDAWLVSVGTSEGEVLVVVAADGALPIYLESKG